METTSTIETGVTTVRANPIVNLDARRTAKRIMSEKSIEAIGIAADALEDGGECAEAQRLRDAAAFIHLVHEVLKTRATRVRRERCWVSKEGLFSDWRRFRLVVWGGRKQICLTVREVSGDGEVVGITGSYNLISSRIIGPMPCQRYTFDRLRGIADDAGFDASVPVLATKKRRASSGPHWQRKRKERNDR